MAISRPLSFLYLPAEVRLEIYKTCIADSVFETLREVYPLLKTCCVVRGEAQDIFDNHGCIFPTVNRLYAFLRAIGGPRRGRLRRLAFRYAAASGDADGENKWADLELMRRAFKLLKNQCHALRHLRVHVSEVIMSRDLGTSWAMTPWRKHDRAARYLPVVTETQGLLELSRLRGLRSVEFVPYEGTTLTDHNRWVLDEAQAAMMTPPEAQRKRKKPKSE